MEDQPSPGPWRNRRLAVAWPLASCRPADCLFGGERGTGLLGVCVHTSANDVPADFTLLKIEAPELPVQVIERDGLPARWQSQLEFTRDLGTAWLQKKDTVLLRVLLVALCLRQ